MTEHEHETWNDTSPSAQQPSYGGPPADGQQYGQPAAYPPPAYGQPAYGQPAYGQQVYGQPAYGQPASYGPPPYGQYGQPAYGQFDQFDQGAVPAKPAQVVVPGVLGIIFGAFGILVTLGLFFLGVVATGASKNADSSIPELGSLTGAIGGVVITVGVLALAWTVLMIWGSVWALRGRSRVLLIVGGSISIATTGFAVLGSLGSMNDAGTRSGPVGVLISLVFFLCAVAIVVMLSMRPAGQFFAAHRARRGR
jgi:hypothetical protein